MSGSPRNQLLRRIAPAQPERGAQGVVAARHGEAAGEQSRGQSEQSAETVRAQDAPTKHLPAPRRKPRLGWGALKAGTALVEATIAMSILTAVGLVLLKLSLNVVAPRQWTVLQSITDAHMSFEGAWAQRIPFEDLTSGTSPWPLYPSKAESQVEMGKLPGGRPIMGTVVRTRMPHANNLPADGGSGTTATNPGGMVAWQLTSVVRYKVGARTYVKSRTVVRNQ